MADEYGGVKVTAKSLCWVAILAVLTGCVPMRGDRAGDDFPPARRAPSAFDLEFTNPDIRVLNRTVLATASFDVIGRETIAAASGVGVEYRGQYFLLTVHHVFRDVGAPSQEVLPLGRTGQPGGITCLRQREREYCPSEALSLLALPDQDIAVIGPFNAPPTTEILALEARAVQRRELIPGQLMFSWSYPYGFGPSFSRSSYAYVQTGPLLHEQVPLGTGESVDIVYLVGWVSPGESGSPLFSFAGDLAGIVNGGGAEKDTGIGYLTAMPAWGFVPALTDLISAHFDAEAGAN